MIDLSFWCWNLNITSNFRSIPWLLMSWWCKEPGHQQPCYAIEYVAPASPCLPQGKILSTCAISRIKYYWKCKYIFQYSSNKVSAARVNGLMTIMTNNNDESASPLLPPVWDKDWLSHQTSTITTINIHQLFASFKISNSMKILRTLEILGFFL